MAGYDKITQKQLEVFVDQVRAATGSQQAIVIVIGEGEKPGEWESSAMINVAAGAVDPHWRMIMAMLRTANAALQERTAGACSVVVRTPDGVQDLPQGSIKRFEVVPG